MTTGMSAPPIDQVSSTPSAPELATSIQNACSLWGSRATRTPATIDNTRKASLPMPAIGIWSLFMSEIEQMIAALKTVIAL